MTDDNRRETGARKLGTRTGTDPNDAFSQEAAENKPPAEGAGLSRHVTETVEETHEYDGVNKTASRRIERKEDGRVVSDTERVESRKAPV